VHSHDGAVGPRPLFTNDPKLVRVWGRCPQQGAGQSPAASLKRSINKAGGLIEETVPGQAAQHDVFGPGAI